MLEECFALNEGFDPADRGLTPLKSDDRFRELVAQVSKSYPPVHHARVALTVAQNDLFPEGLAVDPTTHVFYMGSMHYNKIVKFTESGQVTDFVSEAAYDLSPVGGVHVDPADHSVWCATDPGDKNRSEIVHFSPAGKLLERYAAPGIGPHDLNDLVLRAAKEVYVTDTEGNRVYRFDRLTHTFAELSTARGKHGRPVFYPNGITLSDDGDVLFVADSLGILRIDLRTSEVRELVPDAHDTLSGVDGLYWYKGGLVGVQYGTGAFRVMRWKLSPDKSKVAASKVLERGTEMVRDPTTGAIYDDKFYFMANTGIDNLDRSGKIVDHAKLQPVRIAVVDLK